MKTEVADIIRKAAILMGENPELMGTGSECETATLADRLRLEIELRAAEAVTSTPPALLDGWKSLPHEGMAEMEDGSVMLPLPSDFLMLHTLRLEGWERDVTEISNPDTLTAKLQKWSRGAMKGSRQRPVAVMTPTDTGKALRLHGAHAMPPEMAEGWYMPYPVIAPDGFIDLPAAVIPRLVRMLAECR